jgi:hypothetical protein
MEQPSNQGKENDYDLNQAQNLQIDIKSSERMEGFAKLSTENDPQVKTPGRGVNVDGILKSPQILNTPYSASSYIGLGLSALPDVLMTPSVKNNRVLPTSSAIREASFFPDAIPSPTMKMSGSPNIFTMNGIPTPPTTQEREQPSFKMNYGDDNENLRKFLESVDLGKYYDVFIDQEIDFQTLASLTDEDLKELGISKLGARRKLLAACEEIFGRRKLPLYEDQLK